MSETQLVAVLGYSKRGAETIDPVCAARLARAVDEVGPGDSVLFSGRRRRGHASEAELMARAWNGRSKRVLLDGDARTTYGNALRVAAVARALEAPEIVLVTSRWHGRRASTLLRAAHGARVTLAATDDRGTIAARLRELACWALVPAQAPLAARARYSPRR